MSLVIGLSKERPILGDNPKAHKICMKSTALFTEKHCTFHEVALFTEKHCTFWPNFIIVYPNDCFQDHLTSFYPCVPYWLLSRPFDLILSLCTQLTPFKTMWPDFCVVYPNGLLPRLFDLILSLCTQLTPFKTIWPDVIIVYPIDSFQDHLN